MSIILNTNRIGNLSNSKIYKVFESKKVLSTYIAEKNIERKMKRCLSTEVNTRSTLWGKFLEYRVNDMLHTNYILTSDLTITHPIIKHWVGSPDFLNNIESVNPELKCYQPKAFGEYVDMLESTKGDTEIFKNSHPEEYWQLVGNAILTDSKYIEAIAYMPYESELTEIRMEAENWDGEDQYKYRFIYECDKTELAYLPNDSGYKNLNIFRFELNQNDVKLLTDKVIECGKLLIPMDTTL